MEKKTKKIEVLCTEKQFEYLSKKAKANAMSNSEFGLFCMSNVVIHCDIGSPDTLHKWIELYDTDLKHGKINEEQRKVIIDKLIKDGGDRKLKTPVRTPE